MPTLDAVPDRRLLDEPGAAASERRPWRLILRGLAVAGALGILWLAGREGATYLPRFSMWVDSLGVWGPVAFGLGYALATVALVPGSLLTLAAGAIFGLATGTVLVFLAATVGASAAFLIARHGARKAVERRIQGDARFAAIDRAVGREGRKIVLLLRLSPVFPFTLLNYALGLTRVRFVDYLVASIGMLPGTIAYVYYGSLAGDVATAASGHAPSDGMWGWVLRILGLLATVAVTAVVTRTARRALREATHGADR